MSNSKLSGLKIKINMAPETMLCRFVAAVVLMVFLTNLFSGFSSTLGISSSRISLFFKMIIVLMLLVRAPLFIRRFDRHIMVFICISFLVIVLNLLFFPNLKEYFMSTAITFVTFCIPVYVVCYQITDYEELNRIMFKLSCFIAFVVFIFTVGVFSGVLGTFNRGKYSMGLGYSCIIPSLFLSSDYIRNKNKLSLLGVFVFIVAIISFCSRGPLIELVLFFMYFLIRNLLEKKKFVRLILLFGISIALFFTYKRILYYFALFLQNLGLQSRVIRTLSTDTLYLSGRDLLYSQLIPEILDNPFKVRGINAEWSVLGVYAHNFILELIYQFGVILGGVIVAIIIYRVYRSLTYKKLDEQRMLCVVLMFACFPQILVSSSIWTNSVFWMWMAIAGKIYSYRNKSI